MFCSTRDSHLNASHVIKVIDWAFKFFRVEIIISILLFWFSLDQQLKVALQLTLNSSFIRLLTYHYKVVWREILIGDRKISTISQKVFFYLQHLKVKTLNNMCVIPSVILSSSFFLLHIEAECCPGTDFSIIHFKKCVQTGTLKSRETRLTKSIIICMYGWNPSCISSWRISGPNHLSWFFL